jgi:catechol 2,3-dioxygenase-like lactoylglutathione lyase family enzyme
MYNLKERCAMEFLQIKETCLYFNDLEKARIFYHEVLGLPLIHYLPEKHLFLRAGKSVLLLFNPADSVQKTSPPAHYGGGKQHFAFEVNAKSYEASKIEVAGKGIAIIDEITWKSGKKSFYFNDPEGNVLEILPEEGIWD